MRTFLTTILIYIASFAAMAEVHTEGNRAWTTIDSLTTELTVYSPSVVRVTKYIGERPELAMSENIWVNEPCIENTTVDKGHGKVMLRTGLFRPALNEKDGNVSFWSEDDTLILAEQHKTTKIADGNATLDFQVGKSKPAKFYSPHSGADLKGSKTEAASFATGEGYMVIWNTPSTVIIDDTPGRTVKKPGDVTVTVNAPIVDYFFVFPTSL